MIIVDFLLAMISENDFKTYGCPYCDFSGGVPLIINSDGVLLLCAGQLCGQVYFVAKHPESLVNTKTYPNFLLPSEHPFARGWTSRMEQSFRLPFMPALRCFKCSNIVNYQTVSRFKVRLTLAGLRKVLRAYRQKRDILLSEDSFDEITIFHDAIYDHMTKKYFPHSLIMLDAFNVTLALIWIGACPAHEDDLQEVEWLKTMRAAMEKINDSAQKESDSQGSRSNLPERIDLDRLTIESMFEEWGVEDQGDQSS